MLKALKFLSFVLLVVCLSVNSRILAQEDTVAVPDLTGLSVPEAAAQLNRSGLNLGSEKSLPWTESATQPKDKIASQSVAAGEKVTRNTPIEVTVLRTINVLLLYDYDGLTIVNKTGDVLDLGDVTLNTFPGRRWRIRRINAGQCAQIWAVSQRSPKPIPDCAGIQTWFWSKNVADHFWRSTETNPTVSFKKGGTEHALCEAAKPDSGAMKCELYVASAVQDESTDYVYLAYSTDHLIIRNRSKAEWMPLAGLNLVSAPPGAAKRTFTPADIKNYPSLPATGRIDRLAPGQCLWFANRAAQVMEPPEACDVVTRLERNPDGIFWGSDFTVDSVTDNEQHVCPAAIPGKLTICAMPR